MAKELADAAVEREFYVASDLETITGISSETWLYRAWRGDGPPSFKLGRRRVWPVDGFGSGSLSSSRRRRPRNGERRPARRRSSR